VIRVLSLLSLTLIAVSAEAQSNGSPTDGAVAGVAAAMSTAQGVYSDAQATKGRTAFEMYCASCHAASDYAGEQFRMNWFGRRVSDLFRVLKTTMPEDNIGGLSDDDYTRVITYILKLNGFPAGQDSLPSDSTLMRAIRIGPADTAAKSPGR
jgi:mono/diheme cytochrome c family protein